jgi:hypothetical protein
MRSLNRYCGTIAESFNLVKKMDVMERAIKEEERNPPDISDI